MKDGFWKDKRVFITGATGFIGQHLTSALLDEGAFVVALIKNQMFTKGFRYALTRTNVVVAQGDVEDISILEHTISRYAIDTVFHLAAKSLVGASQEAPLLTLKTNVLGTCNILEACRLHPCVKRVIIASSDKAYGDNDVLPYTEDMPLRGLYPYDVSKACADMIAQSYFHTYSVPVFITRSANVYGPGDYNFSRIIPGSIRHILRGEPPIIRCSSKYTRDYLYVDDLVRGYLSLGNFDQVGEAFNFGTGSPVGVSEMMALLLEITGNKELEPTYSGTAQLTQEITHQWLDPTKTKKLLKWAPDVGLKMGLRKTIEWYRGIL